MRPFEKKNAIKKANLLAEQRYLESKGINEEFQEANPIDNNSEPINKNQENNTVDSVKLDVPLLIRLMEFSREDAVGDVDLHVVAENLVKLSESGESLTMESYESAIDGAKTKEDSNK
jgi:hypothetical protein